MRSALFKQPVDAEKICLAGLDHLLTHEKKLLNQMLASYTPETISAQLIIVLNDIKNLCNSSLSGLKLPELMIRDTLRNISGALTDHVIFDNGNTKQITQEFKGLINLYMAFENAGRMLDILKTEHKNKPLSAQDLQQRVAALVREFEYTLNGIKHNFADGSEQQQKVQYMINSALSLQRHMVNKILHEGKASLSPSLPSSARLTH